GALAGEPLRLLGTHTVRPQPRRRLLEPARERLEARGHLCAGGRGRHADRLSPLDRRFIAPPSMPFKKAGASLPQYIFAVSTASSIATSSGTSGRWRIS